MCEGDCAGQYQVLEGKTTFAKCAKDTFAPATGSTACLRCEPSSSTAAEEASKCTCDPKYFESHASTFNKTVCQLCPLGALCDFGAARSVAALQSQVRLLASMCMCLYACACACGCLCGCSCGCEYVDVRMTYMCQCAYMRLGVGVGVGLLTFE